MLHDAMAALRTEQTNARATSEALDQLKIENAALKDENQKLRLRVQALETAVLSLRQDYDSLAGSKDAILAGQFLSKFEERLVLALNERVAPDDNKMYLDRFPPAVLKGFFAETFPKLHVGYVVEILDMVRQSRNDVSHPDDAAMNENAIDAAQRWVANMLKQKKAPPLLAATVGPLFAAAKQF